jgi:hypothetical protein
MVARWLHHKGNIEQEGPEREIAAEESRTNDIR